MLFNEVLVTGGAGFIGSQLLKSLAPISKHIYVIDDLFSGNKNAIPDSKNITFYEDTYLNQDLLKSIIPKVEYVFHVACRNLVVSVEEVFKDFETNLYGGYLLLDTIKSYGKQIKKVVYTSTSSIYGAADIIPTPESYYKVELPYAASKFSTEHYCQVFYHLYNLPVTICRLSNVYGPGQLSSNPYCGVIAKFFDAVTTGKPMIIYGDGSQTRDFTYVDDVIDALLLMCTHSKTTGQVYNIGTGIETSIASLAEKIHNITERFEPQYKFMPKRTVDKVPRRAVDVNKIQNELNWIAKYNLDEGLRKTVEWMRLKKERD